MSKTKGLQLQTVVWNIRAQAWVKRPGSFHDGWTTNLQEAHVFTHRSATWAIKKLCRAYWLDNKRIQGDPASTFQILPVVISGVEEELAT